MTGVGQLSDSIQRAIDEARAAADERERQVALGNVERRFAADIANAKAERVSVATGIRDTLPPFVRLAKPADLEARICAALLPFARTIPGSSTLIVGPTAAGKTVAMAIAFRRLLAAGVEQGGPGWARAAGLCWYDASELARARRGWPLGQGDPPQFERAIRASMLFLDDLGQERADDGSVRDVLNDRYAKMLPTIVTSGMRVSEIEARYDTQIVRRILQGGQIVDVFPKE